MPNHIRNRIELKGSPEKIDALVKEYSTFFERKIRKTHDEKQIICINKSDEDAVGWLDPETNIFSRREMKDVKGMPGGWEYDYDEAWTRFPDFDKVFPMPEAVKASFGQPGANPAWYQWSCDNWGTKWNSYECSRETGNVFLFDTAWSGVPKIIEQISLKHPDIEIVYEYSDEDTGHNCGIYRLKNGIQSANVLEGGSREAYELAFKLRPDWKDGYELVNGNYQYKDEE